MALGYEVQSTSVRKIKAANLVFENKLRLRKLESFGRHYRLAYLSFD